ncbi:sugar phosphate isomerase/epimerase family protein [Streptococcus dentiloxodontae]
MKREDLILNTIVFKEQLDTGVSQADLIELAASFGIKRLEIRREFLQDISQELSVIRQKADTYAFDLFYSVNEDLIVDKGLNPELSTILAEAQQLQVPFVKLNIGDVSAVTSSVLLPLADLMASYQVGIRLENNQTPVHAGIANCVRAMDLVKEAELAISFVFDTANWVFVDQPIAAAVEKLSSVTTYLHCKNYQFVDGKPEISGSLFTGELVISELAEQFPHLEYLALEYPCDLAVLKNDIEEFSV